MRAVMEATVVITESSVLCLAQYLAHSRNRMHVCLMTVDVLKLVTNSIKNYDIGLKRM